MVQLKRTSGRLYRLADWLSGFSQTVLDLDLLTNKPAICQRLIARCQ